MVTSPQRRRPRKLVDNEVVAPAAGSQHGWDSIVLLPNPLPLFARNAVDTSVKVFGRERSRPILLNSSYANELDAVRLVASSERRLSFLFNVGNLAPILTDRSSLSRLVAISDTFEAGTLLAELPISRLIDRHRSGSISAATLTSIVENLRLGALVLRLDFLEAARDGHDDIDPSRSLELLAELRPILTCSIVLRASSGFPRATARKLRDSGAAGFMTGGDAVNLSGMIPQAAAIRMLRGLGAPIIAEARYTTGAQAARAIALGADLVAPQGILAPGHGWNAEDLDRWIDGFAAELEEAMFASGARTLANLRQAPFVATGETREWLEAAETLWKSDSGND